MIELFKILKGIRDLTCVHILNSWNYQMIYLGLVVTRMWANDQHDGRPAEHRWRRLFNAAKFG